MPKKLKLGVSAAWSSDASGWGVPSNSKPADDWGGWGDSWGNTTGDVWDTVDTEPAAADPPPNWGYDDGWDGPAPDLQAEDLFPSLSASKPPSKRGKTSSIHQSSRPKPADFSTVLGTKVSDVGYSYQGISNKQTERMRTRTDSQEGKSWIQNSIDKNKNRSQVDKSGTWDTGQPRSPSSSYLQQATTQPTKSLKDILHIPAQQKSTPPAVKVSQKSESIKDLLNIHPPKEAELETRKMRPTKPWFLQESTDSTKSGGKLSSPEASYDSTSQSKNQTAEKSKPNIQLEVEVSAAVVKKPIYEQLRDQLREVSSLGKPLVYIIQNGNITIEVAE